MSKEGKKCNICLTNKSLSLFNRNASAKDGYRNSCKECRYIKIKSNRRPNRVQQKEAYEKEFLTQFEKLFEQAKQLIHCEKNIDQECKVMMKKQESLIKEYQQKIFVLYNFSEFSIQETNKDDMAIQMIVQQYIVRIKKVILEPSEMKIIRKESETQIFLPNKLLLSKDEIKALVSLLAT